MHLYTTFVLTIMWNWFVTPTFHVSDISFLMMYGLVLVVSLFQSPSDRNFAEDHRWKGLMTAVEACIPPDRMEEVKEEISNQQSEMWWGIGSSIFARAFGNTVALGIGFVVHILAST